MSLGRLIKSAIGPALGGVAEIFGARSANRANRQMAREQMAFQERMSNTANQRAADDLSKAGLNRILAFGKPASSPTGALAQQQNELSGAVSTAMSARRMREDLKKIADERRAIQAAARASNATASKTAAEAGIAQQRAELYRTNPSALQMKELGLRGNLVYGAGKALGEGTAKAVMAVKKHYSGGVSHKKNGEKYGNAKKKKPLKITIHHSQTEAERKAEDEKISRYLKRRGYGN